MDNINLIHSLFFLEFQLYQIYIQILIILYKMNQF